MSNATVLVVDDDSDVRGVAVRQLTSLGYHVVAAESGVQALALLDATPDVALMLVDVSMPGGMNGPEVAARAASTRADLKILFASGNYEATLPATAHFIAKPYRKRELAEKILEVLGASAT
jgi:CheY-like chemotaxis protein